MKPRGLKAAWQKVTNTYGYEASSPSRMRERQKALRQEAIDEGDMVEQRAYAPHCDSSVLHSPGVCEYCDHYPDWQEYRKVARIAFSDEEPSDNKAPCPSTHFRPARVRDLWGGNVPNGSWLPNLTEEDLKDV